MTSSPGSTDNNAHGDSEHEAIGQPLEHGGMSPQVEMPPTKPSRMVWGYFSCGIPAVTFAIALAGFAVALDALGIDEKTAAPFAAALMLTGCAAGIGFGITGIVRDRRKRAYSYWGILLSIILAYAYTFGIPMVGHVG